ncbi:MAG TPA: TIGR04086 family membrane protein [Candidatus Dormibacteraeota bacterium]|nr:TIGR04086 family membrane protein [Candidatus Dormibacteraeota bacterium]
MAAYVHPRSTSWGAVLGGWLAALGSLAIFFPLAALAAGFTPAAQARVDDPTLAFPLVLALFLSWLIGGYVAGRMSGYRRSWHGLMSAIWGLFVALVVALVAGGNAGAFSNLGASMPRLDVSAFGNAAVFGFVLGIAATIIAGWLGGLLAPPPYVPAVAPREAVATRREPVVARREPVMPRRDVVRERPVREREPSFWDRLTGRDREAARERETAREREVVSDREREGEGLVPPAQPVGAERDGKTVREDTETPR